MKETKPIIIPKAENADKRFHYTATDKQIREHQKRSVIEIFEWLRKNIQVYLLSSDP